jgi:hypothetical protein
MSSVLFFRLLMDRGFERVKIRTLPYFGSPYLCSFRMAMCSVPGTVPGKQTQHYRLAAHAWLYVSAALSLDTRRIHPSSSACLHARQSVGLTGLLCVAATVASSSVVAVVRKNTIVLGESEH